MTKEQEMEFAEKEHEAGFHNTYTEKCSECYKENRLVQAHKVVNFDNTLKFFGDINKVIYGINPYK